MLNISQLNQTTVFSYVQKQCKQGRNTDGGAKQCAYNYEHPDLQHATALWLVICINANGANRGIIIRSHGSARVL